MTRRLVGALFCGCLLVGAACSGQDDSQSSAPSTSAPASTVAPTSTALETTLPPTTADPTTTTVVTTTTTTPPTTVAETTTIAETTTVPPETTVAPAPAAPAPDPACMVEIKPGDSLNAIVTALANPAITVEGIQAENAIADPDTINAGVILDVCIGNGIDDLTGQPRVPPTTLPPAPVAPTDSTVPADPSAPSGGSGVAAQQQKLNELFAGLGLPALTVDGSSGRLTEQQLCAARMALGMPASRADMEPGGPEEQALMAAGSVAIPSGAPTDASRWALIDQTCQIMFVGEGGNQVVFVFQTSTGQPSFRTRDQNASRVFRYDPARNNGGWHDSIDYPAPGDNPLNGNMYKPLYFDNGQAIHGANNVPPEPRSHGCARLRVASQDALIDWLGLGDVGNPLWDRNDINLTVSVQGRY